ncbi:hypothetical protein [Alistipes sp.]|uniref:hypothetical protein n=1 Tax=Alistipes sp. TaxID=1872444 RepID=UPI003AF11E3A
MNLKILSLFLLLLPAACSHAQEYVLELHGTTVRIRSADGVVVEYKPEFTVLSCDENPDKQLRRGDFGYRPSEGQTQGLLYNVPTWGRPDRFVADPAQHVEDGYDPETDRAYGPDRTADYFRAAPCIRLTARSARNEGDRIVWEFEPQPRFTLRTTLSASRMPHGLPMVRMELTPTREGWYSVGYTGAPAYPLDQTDEIWQAHIWSEKRFPNRSFLSEAFRLSVPAVMVTRRGITTAVVADPRYIPFTETPPDSRSSQFGVTVRNREGDAQPILFAPVLGNRDSRMRAGETFAFEFYLYQRRAPLLACFEQIAREVCHFSDLRRNTVCNLNATIENMIDYCLSPHAMFIDSLRGCNYSTDVPGAVKNISGLHPLESAILTDDEHIFRRMARPMLEYGLSRERFLFSTNDRVKGQGTSSRLNGPGVPVTDLLAAYTYSGDRSDYFLSEARRLYDAGAVRSLNLDYLSYEDRWLNSLALYCATGRREYLVRAVRDADRYLDERVARRQTDYSDRFSLGWFFWTSFTNQWMELLWMYELTGHRRYLDAAHEGARYYAQFCWMTPVIPEGTVRVNRGGVVPRYRRDSTKYVYMRLPEADVEAWKVSEIGLTPESSGTSAGHRAIFMAHHAPFMMRIAALTGDRFLHDIARSAVVGRYAGFPGYHINAGRTDAFERADFALRPQAELNGHTSIHYNHPLSHVAMLWDYLFSDVYYASGRRIDFPVEYSEGYAYCRSFIYGAHPGTFYGEKGVRAYMPRGMICSSDVQANYLAAYGNGKLCVALVNQSEEAIETTLSFDPATSFVDPAEVYRVRLWKQNRPAGSATLREGRITVPLAGRGITALVIEGVEVRPRFQHKLLADSGKWRTNHTSVGFEKDRAVVLDFGAGLRSVYLWHEADNSRFVRTRLHYAVDGKWSVTDKTGYPYEYTVELPDDASRFEYRFEALRPDGSVARSATGTLHK